MNADEKARNGSYCQRRTKKRCPIVPSWFGSSAFICVHLRFQGSCVLSNSTAARREGGGEGGPEEGADGIAADVEGPVEVGAGGDAFGADFADELALKDEVALVDGEGRH